MKITFKSENGFSPQFIYGDTVYYLYEKSEANWQLMSKRKGVIRKSRFYKDISPRRILDRYFQNKTGYKYERTSIYTLYTWNGRYFITDGTGIVVTYQEIPLRPVFDTYRECLADAKEYLMKVLPI